MAAFLLDSSVWVASSFELHLFHSAAQTFLEQATTDEPAVFCRATQQSFLRLSSTPALLKAYGAEGLSNRDALMALEALLHLPQVVEREEPAGVATLWHSLATLETASPKVWMDAYLAAFAVQGNLKFVTLDADFKNYEDRGLQLILLTE